MADIAWRDSYSVSVGLIDRQHRDLVDLLRRLQAIHEAGCTREKRSRSLLELDRFVDYHFVSEENVLADCQFPGLLEHRREHERLLAELREKIRGCEHKTETIETIVGFLMNWWTSCMLGEDKKAAEFASAFFA